ncbi:MAG TPA: hypothetical protein VLH86_00590 [Patescibacteria group bacterium]|nr:hypothetical protein [Patescibacteria group bacterium]
MCPHRANRQKGYVRVADKIPGCVGATTVEHVAYVEMTDGSVVRHEAGSREFCGRDTTAVDRATANQMRRYRVISDTTTPEGRHIVMATGARSVLDELAAQGGQEPGAVPGSSPVSESPTVPRPELFIVPEGEEGSVGAVHAVLGAAVMELLDYDHLLGEARDRLAVLESELAGSTNQNAAELLDAGRQVVAELEIVQAGIMEFQTGVNEYRGDT